MMQSNYKLVARSLLVPFRIGFNHASCSRHISESVFVSAMDNMGNTGYGEACPRYYVTGETLNSALKFINKHSHSIPYHITDLASLKHWVQRNNVLIDHNPAAWCAIELALLDLFAKRKQQTIEQLLQLPSANGNFRYSAVVGAGNNSDVLKQYLEMGFTDFKLKLCGQLPADRANLSFLLQHKQSVRLRVDANNLWYKKKQAIDYLASLDVPLFAVEEPVQPLQFKKLRNVAHALETKIILDESFLNSSHFDHLAGEHWIINTRLSKFGGLLRTLAIATEAEQRGIPIIVGCHVGESSLLTRAAMALCGQKNIIAREGAYSTHLMDTDIAYPNLKLGTNGLLRLPELVKTSPGFGLYVNLPS